MEFGGGGGGGGGDDGGDDDTDVARPAAGSGRGGQGRAPQGRGRGRGRALPRVPPFSAGAPAPASSFFPGAAAAPPPPPLPAAGAAGAAAAAAAAPSAAPFPVDAESFGVFFPREPYPPPADSALAMQIRSFVGFADHLPLASKALVRRVCADTAPAAVVDIDLVAVRRRVSHPVPPDPDASEWDDSCGFFDPTAVAALDALTLQPHNVISALGLALFVLLSPELRASVRSLTPYLYNHTPTTPMPDVKTKKVGSFVAVMGTVLRVGTLCPLTQTMDFVCERCSAIMRVPFDDGRFVPVRRCATRGCRSGTFHALEDSDAEPGRVVTVDWQTILLQEESDRTDPGRILRTLECEITDSLCESCVPGETVTVCGIVKMLPARARGSRRGSGSGPKDALQTVYIDCNSVASRKQDVPMSLSDQLAISDLLVLPEKFSLLANSVCPDIFGHVLVKAGILLALLGGCRKVPGGSREGATTAAAEGRGRGAGAPALRGDAHVLLVGDPGLGKSQLLRAAHAISPRGVYVCTAASTSTGLTVSLARDPSSHNHCLEAGALVLSDLGLCCIDEFDKVPNQHQALLEAMEQQSVSIAKAGIVTSLPARTAVLAAANPAGGQYNDARTVSENLRMSPALLSRFDLIFILRDRPDFQRDLLMSRHVMQLHHRKRARADDAGAGAADELVPPTPLSSGHLTREADRLEHRLRPQPGFTPVHPKLLQKYIEYARRKVRPNLSPEAAELFQRFFLDLRQKHKSVSHSTPITTRQLESMIRLGEARAKVDLSSVVTLAHAQDVVELMQASIFEQMADEAGRLDFTRSSGVSRSGQMKAFVAQLQIEANARSNPHFTRAELYDTFKRMGLTPGTFDELIDKLNMQSFLLKTARGYKMQTM